MHLSLPASFTAIAFLLISACSSTPATSQAPEPAPVSSRCNAAPAQFSVGRNADAALENEARTRAGAKAVRVLRPNQVVTMEFNAERLNLTVDDAGRVTRVSCG
ncbi:I78 family peptidase inhibitor [Polaromonas sp. CT11-55]|uniref:I78 family peptidase inhibitor n=1 Tax=Polaromonas sp. CT11-55 TaxID=3243045 RepID=UPI0039A671DD